MEVLKEIFLVKSLRHDLNSLSLVSKKVYFVTNQVKWKSLLLLIENFSKFEKLKKSFLVNIHSLLVIAYDKSQISLIKNFSKFVSKCGNLTSLLLHIPIINDDDLWIISKYCPGLRDVCLETDFRDFCRITDQGIQNLVGNVHLTGFKVNVDHSLRKNQEFLISARYGLNSSVARVY